MSSLPDVAWPRIAAFVRQHTHDLRNDLNGLDLEAALVADIVTDPEAAESVARMRAEIRKVAAHLRLLSAKFAEARPNLAQIPARDLFLIWKDQLSNLDEAPEVEWKCELGTEDVNVDPAAIATVFHELLANARTFGTGGVLTACAGVTGDRVEFILREPKVDSIDPARWGSTPFVSTRRGGYGLGLCSVVRAVEASGGKITWSFEAATAELVTRISFPLHQG